MSVFIIKSKMMAYVFSLQLLSCFLSLAVSLETGLHSQKSVSTLLNSSAELDPIPEQSINSRVDIVEIKNEFSKSTDLDNHQRGGLSRKRLRKIKDIGMERIKNRTRKQKKETANAKEKIQSQDKSYESKNSKRHNIKSKTFNNTGKQENNEQYSKPRRVRPTILKNAATKSSLTTSLPTGTVVTQTTPTLSRKETTSTKVASTADSDGRSKNRPQRNRHRKPHVHNRQRNRIRAKTRHEKNILSNGKHSTKDRKRQPPRVNTAPIGDVKDTPSGKDIPAQTNAPRRLSEEEVREIRLEMFKKTLAEKLRMTPEELDTPPNRRTAPKIPKYLLEETLQDNAMQRKSDQFFAKDQQVIIPGHDLGRNCIAKRTSGCYSFDLASNIKGDVASAQLWLYKTPDRNDTSVQTFMLYGLEKLRSGRVLAQNQIQRQDSYVREGWVVINITRTVASWVQENKAEEMIAIRCSTCVTRNHKALYGTKHGYKPLIVIKYDKTSLQSRNKRSYDNCDPDFACCKRRLNVNFHKIRMFRIEAPESLAVDYCHGTCNRPHLFTHNHTLIKQKIRFVSEDTTDEMREKLAPCCVPISLMPAMMIVSTSACGAVTSMPDVIVNECGCV